MKKQLRCLFFSSLLMFNFLSLPIVTLHAEQSQNSSFKNPPFFRVYYGSFSATSGGHGYTVYVSYNPSTGIALIDGVDDSNGVPVTITNTSWSSQSWNTSANPYLLTLTDLSIDFTYSGGTGNISYGIPIDMY